MLFLTLTVIIVGVFGVVDAALEYNNDCYSAIRNIIIIINKKSNHFIVLRGGGGSFAI